MSEEELIWMEALDAYGAPKGLTVHERLRGWEQRERKYRWAWEAIHGCVEMWNTQMSAGDEDPDD